MISEKMRLKIANVCYANVAGEFAIFANPRMRGANFTWEWFTEKCQQDSDQWLEIHGVRRTKEVDDLAKEFSKEIAERLVDRFLDRKKNLETPLQDCRNSLE